MIKRKRFIIIFVPLVVCAGGWGALMAWLILIDWLGLLLTILGGFIIGVGAIFLSKPWWRTLD